MSDTPIDQAEHFFSERGLRAGFLVPTSTGMSKSLMDAHEAFRDWLRDNRLHDFETQIKGPEHKVVLRADIVLPTTRIDADLSLYRPNSGGGDPRLWPKLLKASGVRPGNLLAFLKIRPDRVAIINMSNQVLLETVDRPGSPLRSVLDEATKESSSAAVVTTVSVTSAELASKADGAGRESASAHDDGSSDRLALLGELWAFAMGGRAVAAAPTDSPKDLPVVSRAAGVDEAIDWLREDCDPSRSRIVFLTGGPGAGKSHAAAAAVSGLSLEPGVDVRLAQRKYTYFTNTNRKLVLINDATIGSGPSKGALLAGEISDAIEHGDLMLVCVNRGVIVEELAHIGRGGGEPDAGSVVLDWLGAAATDQSVAAEFPRVEYLVKASADLDYLRCAVVERQSQPAAELVSVSVDACSLLEPTPSVIRSTGSSRWFSAEPYQVTSLLQRPALTDTGTSAGALLARVVDLVSGAEPWPSPADLLDPFASNIESLAEPSVRTGLLSVARSAEAVTGTLLTFRDIWGLVVRAIVGGATDQVASDGFAGLLERMQPKAAKPEERFREVQRLAGFRFTQGIFGVGSDDVAVGASEPTNPVVQRLRSVDPVRDAVAGRFAPDNADTGWAMPLMDAFSGLPASGSPLGALRTGIQASDGFHNIVTSFDEHVDEEYREVLRHKDLKDPARQSIVAWYARYLTRLYAVANGVPAFRREVEAWTQAWRMSPVVPTLLDQPLRTLIRPGRSSGDAGSLIPLLESRATPIVGEVIAPKLALRSGSFGIGTMREGEQVFLHVTEEGVKSPPTLLDFAMVRQALSCTAGWIGFTEAAETTAPRLERFRSNQLTTHRGSGIVVVTVHGESKLSVEVAP